jgi:hypothetical protein
MAGGAIIIIVKYKRNFRWNIPEAGGVVLRWRNARKKVSRDTGAARSFETHMRTQIFLINAPPHMQDAWAAA